MKAKFIQRFGDMKLSRKMIGVYLLFAGISSIISIIALQVSLNIYDEKLYEKSLQELDFFIQQVNQSLKEIEDLSFNIAMNNEVQYKLARLSELDQDAGSYDYEMYLFRDLLIDELAKLPYVQNIMYSNDDKIQFLLGVDRGMISQSTYDSLMDRFREKRGGYVYQSPTKEYPYLLSGRDILEKISNTSLDYLGSLIITSDIAAVIKNKIDSLEAEHSKLFVYSQDGVVYQDEEMEHISNISSYDQEQGYEVIRYQNQKYFVCYLKSSVNEWTYVNAFKYSEVFGQTLKVRYMMLMGFALIFLLTVLAMRKVANIITRPLVRLTESMQIVATGDFQGAKVFMQGEHSNDETGMLAQEFHIMLEKIDVLIKENYEKQILLKDTKYKMLQSQINPHFLYNTLNALNWMIKAGRNDEAGKMVMELGHLLHASLAENPYISVSGEVDVAKSYITIQKFRFGKNINFVVATEGNLDNYIVPRMILQPLIENAINYGVEGKLSIGKIEVCVKEEEEAILLQVVDSGRGMTEEEVENIKNLRITPKGHGIGIMNIRERLNITFDSYEFHIDSKMGEGTAISIRIPKISREVIHV